MGGPHDDAPYPVLVAVHGDDVSRDMVRAVARGGGILVVELRAAPSSYGRHLLEVHAPGGARERFLADVVGAPLDVGVPLRLAPYAEVDLRSASLPVPDLALDSLPPRRTDSLPSAEPQGGSYAPSGPAVGDWLMSGSGSQQAVDRVIDQAWLSELARIVDVDAFKEEIAGLLPAVARVLRSGDAPTLSAVITTMRSIMKQDAARGKYAGRVLRSLRDPALLAPFVDEALGGAREPSAELRHVLVETQDAGAQALCAGRLQHVGPASRARFVALVRGIGPAAMRSLAAALRACLARGERGGDLVEDLLSATPPAPDEAMGAAVADLLRGGPVASTTCAALSVFPNLWGERARPVVHGALAHPDPRVVFQAIRGARSLRSIDAAVVRRLDPIASGLTPATDEARVEAATALGEALPEARAEASAVASRAFTAGHGASPALTVALARALVTLGAPNAAALIAQRAAHVPEDVRRRLTSLL